jgi:hypothetical protein
MEKKTFFMVWVENGYPPRFRHSTYESALTEAKRLSEKLQLKAFVLQAVTEVKKVNIQITDLRNCSDELPF